MSDNRFSDNISGVSLLKVVFFSFLFLKLRSEDFNLQQ